MLGRGFIDGSGTSPAPRPGRSTLRVAGRLRWRPWRTSAFGIPPVLLAFAAALILLLSAGAEAVDAQADTVAPELATMDPAVLAADGLTLTLTYNEALNTSSVPASTAFEVKATPPGTGASEGTVAVATTGGVAVTGSTVVLTLSRPIAHSDTSVKVSYTVPTNSPIEDAGNNPAGALTDQAVDNNSTVPYVSIVALHDDATPGIAEPVFRVTRSLVSTDELEVKFTITQGTEYFRSTTHTIDIPRQPDLWGLLGFQVRALHLCGLRSRQRAGTQRQPDGDGDGGRRLPPGPGGQRRHRAGEDAGLGHGSGGHCRV